MVTSTNRGQEILQSLRINLDEKQRLNVLHIRQKMHLDNIQNRYLDEDNASLMQWENIYFSLHHTPLLSVLNLALLCLFILPTIPPIKVSSISTMLSSLISSFTLINSLILCSINQPHF